MLRRSRDRDFESDRDSYRRRDRSRSRERSHDHRRRYRDEHDDRDRHRGRLVRDTSPVLVTYECLGSQIALIAHHFQAGKLNDVYPTMLGWGWQVTYTSILWERVKSKFSALKVA